MALDSSEMVSVLPRCSKILQFLFRFLIVVKLLDFDSDARYDASKAQFASKSARSQNPAMAMSQHCSLLDYHLEGGRPASSYSNQEDSSGSN